MDDEWIPVRGYEGLYNISRDGRIYSIRMGRVKNLSVDKDGYLYTTLFKNKVEKFFRINRLVALNFLYNDNHDNLEVNHKNHIKTDNRVSNLEWCEGYENQRKRSEFKGGKTSKLVGVRLHKPSGKFQSRISIKGKCYHLGLFLTESEAHEEYIRNYNNYYINNILPNNDIRRNIKTA